ncbi:hypothetical protein AYO39_01070 [Actinobacteria bacterium SCGC AG-212-D09]|nr:hypothetical protein AYO39_01070 [Actinobacteria bacterium SCGC AG-212-D09]
MFTDPGSGAIGAVSNAGRISEWTDGLSGKPWKISPPLGGYVYFTESTPDPTGTGHSTNKVGRIAVGGGAVAEFTVGRPGDFLDGITVGADGNLWIADRGKYWRDMGGSPAIYRMTPSGTTTRFDLPDRHLPKDVTTGPDGRLYFTEVQLDGRSDRCLVGSASTDGTSDEWTLNEYGPASPSDPTCEYESIAAGPDGNLWLTPQFSNLDNVITRMTPDGRFTEFPTDVSYDNDIVAGSDGAMWFAYGMVRPGGLGRMTTGGSDAGYADPGIDRLAAASDGNLWFTDGIAHVGRVFIAAPVAQTGGVSSLSGSGATLQGQVNSRGTATTYHFEYGTTAGSYVASTADASAGSNPNGGVRVNAAVSDLRAGATYHYRLVATNANGTSMGADRTFRTLGPTVLTDTPASITGGKALLRGRVTPEGIASTYYFRYGPDHGGVPSWDDGTAEKSAGSGTTRLPVSETISGLTPGTTYDFQLVATDANGTVHGPPIRTFTAR